jgi:endonuclease/exonuclease/phosphatase family metal-dependent hydrolase
MPKSIFRRISKKMVILANVLVALAFWAGCYGWQVFSSTLWPIGILWLAASYLLLVLLFFIVFWLFVKWRWCFLSIAAIAGAWPALPHVMAINQGQPFSQKKASGHLRIMSWNVAQFDILYNKQKPEIRSAMYDIINQYQPDVACLQEMVAADTLVNLNTPYYRKYSFVTVFEFMEKLAMNDYYYTYNFKEDFLSSQHFGLMIVSKFPLFNKKSYRYYPYDYNSNFQSVDMAWGTDTVRIFNLHLQSLKFSDSNRAYINNPSLNDKSDLQKTKSLLSKFKTGFIKRQQQASRIATAIGQSPYPVLVCGDFNDVPNSYAYHRIGQGLQNAFVKKGSGLGRTFSGISPTLRIDNIFVHPSFEVQQFIQIPKKLSDHFPLIADVKKK